jgi:hypothetical protein
VLEHDHATTTSDAVIDVERGDDSIVCSTCDAPVARAQDRIVRFGSHAHDRVNPSGHVFRIGCFGRATGVREVGDSSSEFPWFPAHRWTIVVCHRCSTHLGWRFDGRGRPASVFWGLVLDRLRGS